MNLRGGDILDFSYNSRSYDIKADANITIRLGGIDYESEATGTGGVHTTGKVVLPGLDSVPISIDASKKDAEALYEAKDGEPHSLNITLINGVTYSGQQAIDGPIEMSTGDGQAEVSFKGKTLEQI